MALPAVMNFHNEKMAQERERVLLRIANGLKSDSSYVIGNRRMHPSFKGLPDNSTGSRNMPFFAAKDESQCPLEDKIRMRGGVLHTKAGKEYGYEILKRRARDDVNQRAAAEGLPPQPAPLLELDPVESRSLELDEILAQIDDAADAGDFKGDIFGSLKNIPRLVIMLAPTLSESKIAALIEFLGSLSSKLLRFYEPDGRNMPTIEDQIDADIAEEGLSGMMAEIQRATRIAQIQRGGPRSTAAREEIKPLQRIHNIIISVHNFLKTLLNAKNQGVSEKDLRATIVAAAKEFFAFNRKQVKATFEKLSTPQIVETPKGGPAETPTEEAAVAEAPADVGNAAALDAELQPTVVRRRAPISRDANTKVPLSIGRVRLTELPSYNAFRDAFIALNLTQTQRTGIEDELRTRIADGQDPEALLQQFVAEMAE